MPKKIKLPKKYNLLRVVLSISGCTIYRIYRHRNKSNIYGSKFMGDSLAKPPNLCTSVVLFFAKANVSIQLSAEIKNTC